MRDIKFKLWLPMLGKMTYGLSIKDWANGYEQITISDDCVWLQCTGLKDKNGKEIFEGDIYHMGDPNITYTVVWRDSGLIGKQNSISSYAGIEYWKEKIEVVGNIYSTT